MPTTTVTDPIILDSTGQSILTAINNLTEAVQPTNVCVDISTSLPASGWSSSAPYIQTWTNNKVTDECAVKVEFPSDATGTGITYLEFEKVAGGVKFTAPSKPSVAIPVIVHIINAEAESVTSISGDMVSTNVVSGASNVDQALTAHSTAITDVRLLESLGSHSTLASFTTALDDKLEEMANYTTAVFRIQVSTAFTPFGKTTYVCRLSKINGTTYGSALFESLNTTVTTHLIKGTKNTTWQFDLIALDSDKVSQRGSGQLTDLKINNTGAGSDVISFGGGDSSWGSENVGGIMYTHSGRQYFFRGKGSTNEKNEDFTLPAHSDGNSNQSYDILTTKNYSSTLSRITTFAGTSSNKTFSFDLAQGYHALVAVAAGFVSFFNGSGVLYNTELPSGFTAAISGTTVTITRSNTTAFIVHGIVIGT